MNYSPSDLLIIKQTPNQFLSLHQQPTFVLLVYFVFNDFI